MDESNLSIVFYDGNCGFCNKTIQFILKHEKNNELYFSSLESQFSQNFFLSHNQNQPDNKTFYLYTKGHFYNRSSAAFSLIKFLKWYLKPLFVFSILPKILTDSVYNFISKRRTKISGQHCIIPSQENKHRFLSD